MYDWFLPSRDKLNQMYTILYLAGFGGFVNEFYWTSDEEFSFLSWGQNFLNNVRTIEIKSGNYRVRPVRAF